MSEVSSPPLPDLCSHTSSAYTRMTLKQCANTWSFCLLFRSTWGQSVFSCWSLVIHPLAPCFFFPFSPILPTPFFHLPPIFFYTYPISHTSWKCCFLSFLGWLSQNCCRTLIRCDIPLFLSPCLESKVWLPCTGMQAVSTSNLTLAGSVHSA